MAGRTDQAILGIAAVASGVCTRAELRDAGVAERTIGERMRAGFLVRVGPGVYEVPELADDDTPYHRAAKAYPQGAISQASAARLWGMPVAPAEVGAPVEVSVPRPFGARRRVHQVVAHRVRRLEVEDLAEARPGLVVTAPARTIVDLAGTTIGDRRLRHVAQTAVVAGRATLGEVAASLQRVGDRGVAGAGRLRRLLAELDDGEPMVDSELERRVAALLGPGFRRQYRPPWYDGRRGVVDFADPTARVIIEADGRRWHTTGEAMIEDRRRDRTAAANGWLVLRVAWHEVTTGPAALAAELATTVADRRRAVA